LPKLATEHRITVDHVGYTLDQAAQAWAARMTGPRAMVMATIRGT
jgi:NADPH:quinone reductase